MTTTVNRTNGWQPAELPAELQHYDPEAYADDHDLDAPADLGTKDDATVEATPKRRTNPLVTVADDLRTSWTAVSEPPSIVDWLAGPTTSTDRIPDGHPALRWAWTVDNWATGVLFLAASIALFGLAATFRWLACHPARRWSAILLTAVTCTYLVLA